MTSKRGKHLEEIADKLLEMFDPDNDGDGKLHLTMGLGEQVMAEWIAAAYGAIRDQAVICRKQSTHMKTSWREVWKG